MPVLLYFVVTFTWTWSLWWSAAVVDQLPVPLLFMTGGLGPLVGAAWVVRRGEPRYGREFLRRVWDPRGIPAWSWLALIAVGAGSALLGAGLAAVVGATATVPGYTFGSVGAVVVFALLAGLFNRSRFVACTSGRKSAMRSECRRGGRMLLA